MKAKKSGTALAKKKVTVKAAVKAVNKTAAILQKPKKIVKKAPKLGAKQTAKKAVVTSAAKPLAKSSATGFSLKAAAAKFKSALSKAATTPKAASSAKKLVKPATVSKPAKVAIAVPVKNSPPKTQSLPVKKPTAKPVASKSHYVSPKGVLTEDQIRKMSDKDYMNDAQMEFFRHRLLQMRNEVLERELDVKERLHQREIFADPADRATAEEEHWLDLRLRERESLLLHKIDDTMRRIADKEYGYCEKTGDPIGIPRLLARPTATVCVDVKGQDERIESQFRDR